MKEERQKEVGKLGVCELAGVNPALMPSQRGCLGGCPLRRAVPWGTHSRGLAQVGKGLLRSGGCSGTGSPPAVSLPRAAMGNLPALGAGSPLARRPLDGLK